MNITNSPDALQVQQQVNGLSERLADLQSTVHEQQAETNAKFVTKREHDIRAARMEATLQTLAGTVAQKEDLQALMQEIRGATERLDQWRFQVPLKTEVISRELAEERHRQTQQSIAEMQAALKEKDLSSQQKLMMYSGWFIGAVTAGIQVLQLVLSAHK